MVVCMLIMTCDASCTMQHAACTMLLSRHSTALLRASKPDGYSLYT